jgi:hypothetical protein
LKNELKELPMKTLLAAGFITYMSSTPEDVRHDMLRRWMKETGVSHFELRRSVKDCSSYVKLFEKTLRKKEMSGTGPLLQEAVTLAVLQISRNSFVLQLLFP